MNPLSIELTKFRIAAIGALATFLAARKLINTRLSKRQLESDRPRRLVVITGCDTGLGYSMAVWALTLGYKVLAGCLNDNGEGAQSLQKLFPESVFVAELNVTDPKSLKSFANRCKEILDSNKGSLRLWAIVANAAVSTMGEFFWQTQSQREQQMEVNFWGTVNFISEFRVLLFQNKARVVVISSNCSEYPLPFLSIYCASKAAVDTWTRSFRIEMAKYGVPVVAYQPRDFGTKSRLFANLGTQYNQMAAAMGDYEKKFYGDYFDSFMNKKLEVFECAKEKAIKPLDSEHHKRSFILLLENDMRNTSVYYHFSVIEKILHALHDFLPQRYSDKLATFLLNPDKIEWQEPEQTPGI